MEINFVHSFSKEYMSRFTIEFHCAPPVYYQVNEFIMKIREEEEAIKTQFTELSLNLNLCFVCFGDVLKLNMNAIKILIFFTQLYITMRRLNHRSNEYLTLLIEDYPFLK